ncbi:hypothetical protein, partial [Rubrivivax gelatinosus]|uniref:hypothetical protein n=1 Tax=Rubrivivax gelatinosus TaxID=28068 RepID=UPI001ED981B6
MSTHESVLAGVSAMRPTDRFWPPAAAPCEALSLAPCGGAQCKPFCCTAHDVHQASRRGRATAPPPTQKLVQSSPAEAGAAAAGAGKAGRLFVAGC